MRVLVSGANGFVGSALVNRIARRSNAEVTCILRSAPPKGDDPSMSARHVLLGNLDPRQDWSGIPHAPDVLIHAAARVHVMREDTGPDVTAEYRRVNVDGTLNLASQAADAGLRRFIFISTLKVNGESTPGEASFSAADVPAPSDPYSVSKWQAEQGLRQISLRTGMQVVIVRPPLVYGPGVKGNFRQMLKWLERGIPLPLGAIRNQRSMVNLDNLVDLIDTCIDHPAAANETFLASDGEDLSTPDLLRRTAAALGKTARLIPVPVWLLEKGAAALGSAKSIQRLCNSFRADISKTRRLLNWSPMVSVDDGLGMTAERFLHEAGN